MNADPIKSAARAFAVLEFFNRERQPATVSRISAALDMPQSSTSMLIKCLIELGYIHQIEGSRKYVPGWRAAFLGDWPLERLGQINPLADMVSKIADELGETVTIGTQNGPHVQYVHVASARKQGEIMTRVGLKLPMACTASGRSLLSRMREDKIRGIVRRNNAEAPAHARLSEASVVELILKERLQGFFESRSGFVSGIDNISVPLGGHTKAAPLVVGGPSERIAFLRPRIVSRLTALRQELTSDHLAQSSEAFSASELKRSTVKSHPEILLR